MKVLIAVDMQNDFITGSLGTNEAVSIVPKVVNKIDGFAGRVAVTQDTHHDDYPETQEGINLPVKHCLEQTEGWEIHPEVRAAIDRRSPGNPAAVFKKSTFGSVGLVKWLELLNGSKPIEEIVLVGLCTDICVISNALLIKAHLPEIPVTVDAACCAGVSPESHQIALDAMKTCQVKIMNG